MYTELLSFDSSNAVDKLEVSDEIFGQPYRPDILSMVVRWQLAKRRLGCHKTKGISEVSGTTRKPYRQKGTGRARQGSLRSAQFRGGGIIFGPVVRTHGFSLNKKYRTLGLKVALSSKLAKQSLFFLKEDDFSSVKTSLLKHWFSAHELLDLKSSTLFVLGDIDVNLCKACANLSMVNVLPIVGLNVYDLLRYDNVVISQAASYGLNKRFGCI